MTQLEQVELEQLRALVEPVRAVVARIDVETKGWIPDDVVRVVCALARLPNSHA